MDLASCIRWISAEYNSANFTSGVGGELVEIIGFLQFAMIKLLWWGAIIKKILLVSSNRLFKF
jgi:hypothetical protein